MTRSISGIECNALKNALLFLRIWVPKLLYTLNSKDISNPRNILNNTNISTGVLMTGVPDKAIILQFFALSNISYKFAPLYPEPII